MWDVSVDRCEHGRSRGAHVVVDEESMMQAVVECGKHDAAVAAASHMCVKVQGIK